MTNNGKKKCLNCGYERQPEDESEFIPESECPKCRAIYEKVEKWHNEKERKTQLLEEERQNREENDSNQKLSLEDSHKSALSKPFNEKTYKITILVLVILVIGFAYLYWNNHSSSEAEKVAIKKQVDAERDAAIKLSRAKINTEQEPLQDNNVRPDVKNDSANANNSSENNNTNQFSKLSELKKKIEGRELCARLFLELHNLANENIELATNRHKIRVQELDTLRIAVTNKWPESVQRERTQDMKDKGKELDIRYSLNKEKQSKIDQELNINNCK